MNYQEFKDYISEHIKEHLPAEYQDSNISFVSFTKNNNTHREGLQIQKDDESAMPCIYMDNFFKDYQSGEKMVNIMESIATAVSSSTDIYHGFAFDINQISNFDSMKNRVICRLVNKDSNSEILSNVPFTPFENLAATYHILVNKQSDSLNTLAISNKMLKDYGISVDKLHEAAVQNMDSLMPPKFESMSDMLHRLAPPGMDAFLDNTEDSMPLYILTNETGIYGASVLLNKSFMDRVTTEIGKDLVILPSSVHEVIAFPRPDVEDDVKGLEDIVKSINANYLAPEDFLSNSVYEYHAENHRFIQCARAHEPAQETSHESKQKADKENPIKAHAKSSRQISPQEEISL